MKNWYSWGVRIIDTNQGMKRRSMRMLVEFWSPQKMEKDMCWNVTHWQRERYTRGALNTIHGADYPISSAQFLSWQEKNPQLT
jgi:hypothetical protein